MIRKRELPRRVFKATKELLPPFDNDADEVKRASPVDSNRLSEISLQAKALGYVVETTQPFVTVNGKDIKNVRTLFQTTGELLGCEARIVTDAGGIRSDYHDLSPQQTTIELRLVLDALMNTDVRKQLFQPYPPSLPQTHWHS